MKKFLIIAQTREDANVYSKKEKSHSARTEENTLEYHTHSGSVERIFYYLEIVRKIRISMRRQWPKLYECKEESARNRLYCFVLCCVSTHCS